MRATPKKLQEAVTSTGSVTQPVDEPTTQLTVLCKMNGTIGSDALAYTLKGKLRSLGAVVTIATEPNLEGETDQFQQHVITNPEIYESITMEVTSYTQTASTFSAAMVQRYQG